MTEYIITPIDDKEALHPNMLKCVNCGEPAAFHVNGKRVCSDEVCVRRYAGRARSAEYLASMKSPKSLDDTIWELERELKKLAHIEKSYQQYDSWARTTSRNEKHLPRWLRKPVSRRGWLKDKGFDSLDSLHSQVKVIVEKLDGLYEQQTRRDLEILQEE